jgi:hypothetical protein
MSEHDRIIVDIQDAGLGRYGLRDLVGVLADGNPVPMSRNCRMPASAVT